jgi:ribosome-associated protein
MDIPVSRSERKRRIKQLGQLVNRLSSLSPALIDALPCGGELTALLRQASSLKGGARKRELKYITKLLQRDPDAVDRLYVYMSERQGADLQERREFHEIEYIRDALLNEALEKRRQARERGEELGEDWTGQVLEEIVRDYPSVDRFLLGNLAMMYARTRNRRHSREIFRLLRAAQEQKKFDRNKQAEA